MSTARVVLLCGLLLAILTGLKLALREVIGDSTPFLLYVSVVMVGAWFGNRVISAVVIVVSCALGFLFMVMPGKPLAVALSSTAVFLVECVAVALLTGRLRALTSRLNAVLSAVGDAVTVQDRKGKLVYANARAAAMLGYPNPETLLRAPLSEVVQQFDIRDEDGAPFPLEELPSRRVFAGRQGSEVSMRFKVRATGAERRSVVSAQPVYGPDGAIAFSVNLFRDVTEARALEQTAKISQRWFATALRSIGDAVITTDRNGVVSFMNPVAETLTGWSMADAVGKHLREIFKIVNESTRLPVESPVEKVIAENVVVGLANTILIRKDNGELAIDDSAAPIRGEHDALVGVVLVFRDVSSKRREEVRRHFIALATSELAKSIDYQITLKNVVRAAVPDVADWVAVDLLEDGKMMRLAVAHIDPNKERMVEELTKRYPPKPEVESGQQRVMRTGVPELMPDIPREVLVSAAVDAEHLGLIDALELRSYMCVPLRIAGKTAGAITFAMAESKRRHTPGDLALAQALADRASIALEHAHLFRELERARSTAVDANRSKDEFLAMLGHELRNPLAPILTALDLMQVRADTVLSNERAIIERQVRHLVRLVDDLLDVSRITRGKVTLNKTTVDLASVIAHAVEMAAPLLDERKQVLSVKVPAGLLVDADAERLSQAFANVLNNAAKYTRAGGTITVSAAREDGEVTCSVVDTGIGISAEMLPRVFDFFSQEKQTIERSQGGLGLGLAIVQSLVNLHGGKVTATSPGIGQGSEFRIRLKAASGSLPVAKSASSPSKAGDGRHRVIVVDDNVDAAELLAEALTLFGFEARNAHDGPSALLLAADMNPVVGLLDIGLPVMDGYELARKMRELPGLAKIKLVAITGYGQSSDRQRSKEAGFDEHLVKPVDIELVRKTIKTLLAQK